MYKRKYGKRKVGGGRSKRRRFGSKKTSRALVTKPMLYRAIGRSQETKSAHTYYTLTTFNSGIGQTGDTIVILPPIVRGSQGNFRIGNKIRPIRMVIRGYICYNTLNGTAYNIEAHQLGCRLFVYENRTSASVANTIVDYNLLTNGNSSQSFTGEAINLHWPVNKEQFKIYADKKFIINKPYGWTDQAAASQVGSATNSITSYDRSMYQPFTIVLTQKHMPAVLHYDDTESTQWPTNYCPLISLGYTHLLNTAVDVTTPLIAMQFIAELQYKDG